MIYLYIYLTGFAATFAFMCLAAKIPIWNRVIGLSIFWPVYWICRILDLLHDVFMYFRFWPIRCGLRSSDEGCKCIRPGCYNRESLTAWARLKEKKSEMPCCHDHAAYALSIALEKIRSS